MFSSRVHSHLQNIELIQLAYISFILNEITAIPQNQKGSVSFMHVDKLNVQQIGVPFRWFDNF